MLKRKFERTRGNRPRIQQFCSTYRDIESFLPKKVHNVQRTEEFVRAIEKFEKLSMRVFESQLYVNNEKIANQNLFLIRLLLWKKCNVLNQVYRNGRSFVVMLKGSYIYKKLVKSMQVRLNIFRHFRRIFFVDISV